MRYLLLFIVIILGLACSVFDWKILIIWDDDEEDDCLDYIKRRLSLGLLAIGEFLITIICNKLNYGILMIVIYSIVLWGSKFLFWYVFYKSEQNKK